MKKIILFAIFVSGIYLFYKIGGAVWIVTWLGLCLAFAITCIKLHLGDAIRLWSLVFVFLLITLGGGCLIANKWGPEVAMLWSVFCIILFMIFFKKIIKRWLPIFYIAQEFDHLVRREMEKDKTKNKKTKG